MRKTSYIFVTFLLIISIIFSPHASADANNTETISVNGTYYGSLTNDVRYRLYEFEITKPGILEVSMSNYNQGSWYFDLLDENGIVLHSDYTKYGSGETKIRTGLTAGKYFLKVYGDRAEYSFERIAGIEYTFNINFTEDPIVENNFERENNNQLSSATEIQPETDIRGIITNNKDTDYYKFYLPFNGKVYIDTDADAKEAWSVSLQSKHSENILTWETPTGSAAATGIKQRDVTLAAGEYYIKIGALYQDNIHGLVYRFNIKYEKLDGYEAEPNNYFGKANLLQFNKNYTGKLNFNGDTDYYKFTIPKQLKELKVQFYLPFSSESTWDFTIYDQKQGYIERFISKEGTKTIKELNLAAGDYYIKVSSSWLTFEPYTFMIGYKEQPIIWGKITVKSNQIGKATILKPTNLIKLDSKGKEVVVKKLSIKSEYPVYSIKSNKYYNVGSGYFIKASTNVKYENLPKNYAETIKAYEQLKKR